MLKKDLLNECLKEAKEMVDSMSFDEPEVKAAALTKTLELLVKSAGSEPQSNELQNESGNNEFFTKLSRKLDLAIPLLKKVYFVKNEEVSLLVKTSDLSKSMRAATREIALLITAARQVAGFEDETSNQLIKELCNRKYRCYDQKNFSTHIADLRDVMHIRTENSKLKFLTIAEPGYEELKILIGRITSQK